MRVLYFAPDLLLNLIQKRDGYVSPEHNGDGEDHRQFCARLRRAFIEIVGSEEKVQELLAVADGREFQADIARRRGVHPSRVCREHLQLKQLIRRKLPSYLDL